MRRSVRWHPLVKGQATMTRLAGKVVIVTGGGSGLGRAMATRFAREGASVLVADINEPGGVQTVAQIQTELSADDRDRVAFLTMNVAEEADCAAAVEDAVSRWGRLDVMVANAGIGAPGSIASLSLDAWERVIKVNLTGVFLCAKYAFRAMRQNPAPAGGVILATASVAGLEGTPGLGAYGPTKAAVIQLVKTLALEGARYNIRANALCPVWTQTPMVDAFAAAARSGNPEQAKEQLRSVVPLGRLGQPEDVANAALYLVSDEASFISGVAFPVDGAHTATTHV
ncbi:MAG: SDR family oxidoreductase [Ktedonobacterales bacterium]